MALAFDHFLRALLITTGALIISPYSGYSPLGGMAIPEEINDAEQNLPPVVPAVDNIPQADAPDTEEDTFPDIGKTLEELNGKIKALKVDQKCFLQSLRTPQICTLTEEELKKINLPNREIGEDDEELTISGLESPKTVTLTIEAGYLDDDFPETLRFNIKNTNQEEVSINGEGEDSVLKPNVGYDYKISLVDNSWLSKGWSSLSHLGKKVGININDSVSDCTHEELDNKTNVWRSETEYVIGANASENSSCPMSYQSDVGGYSEGYKLTVKGNSDIVLTGGTGPRGGTKITKITKDNVSYEIGPKDINGNKKWFLIERTTS